MKALIWLVKAKFSYVYILIKFNFIKITTLRILNKKNKIE